MPITPQEPATIVPLQEPAAPESFQEPIAIVPSQKPIRSSSEANEQRGYISEKGYIGRFLNGTDIKKSFEDAITGLVWEHYHELDNPTYAPNAKARFADHIPHVLHSSLSDFDFEIDIENNQYRLIARDEFFCPVRLRFGLGRVMNSGSDGGCTVFNAKKGKETKKGVKQNHEHFRSQPLLLSRDQMYVEDEDKILNLWLIYEFTKEWISVWLVLGTEKWRDATMYCDEHVLICSKPLTSGSPEKLKEKLPESVDVNVPFGEKKRAGS